jgi:ATP-dependent DNA ligase
MQHESPIPLRALILFDILLATDGTLMLESPMVVRRRALEAFVKEVGKLDQLVLSPCTLEINQAKRWPRRVRPWVD